MQVDIDCCRTLQGIGQLSGIQLCVSHIAESFPQPQSGGVGDQGEGNHLLQVTLLFVHELGQMQQILTIAESFFNGLITNDKFCLTRRGQLKLTWWRRPLRLRK